VKSLWRAYQLLFSGAGRVLVTSTGLALLQAIILVPVSLCVRIIFSTDLPHHRAGAVVLLGLVILVLYVASAGVSMLTRHVVLTASKRAIARLRLRLARHLQLLPRSFFDRHSVNDVYGVMVLDSERLDVVINSAAAGMLPAFIVTFGLAVVAAVIDPLLMAVLLAVIPLMLLTMRLVGERVGAATRHWQRSFDHYGQTSPLAVRSLTLARVLGTLERELEHSRVAIDDLSEAGRVMAWQQSALNITQQTLAAAVGIVVLVVGGYQVASGHLALGALLSFYAVMALLLRQLGTALSAIPSLISGGASLERIETLLASTERLPYAGTRPIDVTGEIELSDVIFGYGDEAVLRGVSLLVPAGEHVAVVGPNGAGKSTVVNLLLGHDRPWSGEVLADGLRYDEIDLASFYAGVGYVPQEPIMFPVSVEDNIRCGRTSISGQQIRTAAAQAGVTSVMDRLVDGLATDAGEEGGLISGGQRQRVAVARALVGEPRLLILDEPTTHLDETGIRELLSTLRSLPQRPTVVVITHDPMVVDYVDRVVELRDGRVHEQAAVEPRRGARSRAAAAGSGRKGTSAQRRNPAVVRPS
jgi:ATP-binding cassette subfamily B protein